MTKNTQHKRTFLTWVAIYPSITLLFWLFGAYLLEIPLLLRTLVLTVILVPLLSYVLLPLLYRICANWLNS